MSFSELIQDCVVALAPSLAVLVAALLSRRRSVITWRKLDEVHFIVNSRLDAALATIGELQRRLDLENQQLTAALKKIDELRKARPSQ